MVTMRDHHASGESFDDAMALLSASIGDDDAECDRLRTIALYGIVSGPDCAEAGARLAAATEILTGLAAGFLEGWAADRGVDPRLLLQDLAIDHAERHPR